MLSGGRSCSYPNVRLGSFPFISRSTGYRSSPITSLLAKVNSGEGKEFGSKKSADDKGVKSSRGKGKQSTTTPSHLDDTDEGDTFDSIDSGLLDISEFDEEVELPEFDIESPFAEIVDDFGSTKKVQKGGKKSVEKKRYGLSDVPLDVLQDDILKYASDAYAKDHLDEAHLIPSSSTQSNDGMLTNVKGDNEEMKDLSSEEVLDDDLDEEDDDIGDASIAAVLDDSEDHESDDESIHDEESDTNASKAEDDRFQRDVQGDVFGRSEDSDDDGDIDDVAAQATGMYGDYDGELEGDGFGGREGDDTYDDGDADSLGSGGSGRADDENSLEDPLEDEYWRVYQRWDALQVWDPERAALLAEYMVLALARNQAKRAIAKLPEMVFYRLHTGKERSRQRARYNRNLRNWKKRLLHARLTFRARCEARKLARLARQQPPPSSTPAVEQREGEGEEEDILIDEFLHKIDPDNVATYQVYSSQSSLGAATDDEHAAIVPVDETLVHELYHRFLTEFHTLQERLNATRQANIQRRKEEAKTSYLKYIPYPLPDESLNSTTSSRPVQQAAETESAAAPSKPRSNRKTKPKRKASNEAVTSATIVSEADTIIMNHNAGSVPIGESHEEEDASSSITLIDENMTVESDEVIDPFYEDFYVDEFDDEVEAAQLHKYTETFAAKLRQRLQDPTTQLKTKLMLARYSVQLEEQEVMKRVRAYWSGTYEKRYFFDLATARDVEYAREEQLYGYTDSDTYEEQLRKRAAYDHRRFLLVARHIEQSNDKRFAFQHVEVNATHAVMHRLLHPYADVADGGHASSSNRSSSTRSIRERIRDEPIETIVLRDFVADNDDGQLMRPPTQRDIDRVNEQHFLVFEEYAREHYAHLNPKFQGPHGDPMEALASWKKKQMQQQQQQQQQGQGQLTNTNSTTTTTTTTAAATKVDEEEGPRRPLLTIRAVISNYTGTAQPYLDIVETLFDAIHRGTEPSTSSSRIRYEIYILDRNDTDALRFYAQSATKQAAELEMLRDKTRRMHEILGSTFDASETHMERLLPMENMMHVWCEGHNVHHLVDGFTMTKLWGGMRREVLLAPRNVAAIVEQVLYALHGEAPARAVLSKRLSQVRSGQDSEPFDPRYALGAYVKNFPGDEMAVVGGRTSLQRAQETSP